MSKSRRGRKFHVLQTAGDICDKMIDIVNKIDTKLDSLENENNVDYENVFDEDELLNYYVKSLACCFIDPGLRRYEMNQIENKIRNDSLYRIWKAKADAAYLKYLNSFPVVGPKRTNQESSPVRYKCFSTGDGYEMCGHVRE